MAFAVNYKRAITGSIAMACTSALVWFGNGLNPVWPLLWFAPLPMLLFALRSSWRTALLTTALSFLAGCFNMWHYFRVLQTPFSVWLAVFSIAALIFALAVLLFRALVLRGAPWSALLAFPATWVCYEYLRNLITPHGTAGCLAYSQLNFLLFLELASITGPWGMTFVLLLFPAALAISIHLRNTAPKQARRILGATLSLIILVLAFGALRLAQPRPPQQVKVGLISSDQPVNANVTAEGADTERLFRNYAVEAQQLAARGARIIVLPEKLGVVLDSENKAADSIFQSLADRTKVTIVVGEVHVSAPVKYNQARVYTPGSPVLTYDKHHMLPPFESSLKPGTTLTLLPKTSETWGVSICKDMDFTPLSRQYGQAGAGLMLVPAWDFNLDRWWHGHIAVMRGVEDGFSIVRAAKDGYLTVSDDRGRILAETRSDSAPFATLLAEVPVVHNATLYLLLGDWFACVTLATLAFALIRLYKLRSMPD